MRKCNKNSLMLGALGLPVLSLGLSTASAEEWVLDSDKDWNANQAAKSNLKISKGQLVPSEKEASFSSKVKKFATKKNLKSIVVEQSNQWLNWSQVPNIGPKNANDAPVFLSVGDKDYYIFARYGGGQLDKVEAGKWKLKEQVYYGKITQAEADKKLAAMKKAGNPEGVKGGNFVDKDPNQTNGTGGEELGLGGYHCWHSTDMKNWTHHGPVSNYRSRWMTTAEYKDGKFYLYYDNPNDQDPHLILDENVKAGNMGTDHGLVFADPSHGSDNAVIRGDDGKFHFIYEDWTPLNASKQAWDSPLAGHAISPDGINDWKILPPAIDHRTKPTGKTLKYRHPHQNPNMLEYQEHLPKQNAYGDWAAFRIGSQYYLFADYDPADNKSGRKGMSCAWFTSSSLDKQFEFCGKIGQGHPDPDITFAEGKFYMITQFSQDFVSPGPWVESVKGRAGVDTDGDGNMDEWTDWQDLKEEYSHKKGYARQVNRKPAAIDTSKLPAGHGFLFELKIEDKTENESKPVIEKVTLNFE